MRLEFARSNTKVTRPKWPPGLPLPPGASAMAGYPYLPAAAGAAAGLSQMGQQSAFHGVVPSAFLPQLAGCTLLIIAPHSLRMFWKFAKPNTLIKAKNWPWWVFKPDLSG